MATTYNNLYMDVRQIMIKESISSASLEAREIVCHASGKTREELVADYHMYVPDEVETEIFRLLKRRIQGEPLAYLIGKWDFYGFEFLITPDVLIPRADTETLVDAAAAFASGALSDVRMLDLCAGSGCVGITLSIKLPNARVVLLDISEDALRVCRRNVRKHERRGYISCVIGDVLTEAPAELGAFDIIVCNPPYIPSGQIMELDRSVSGYEPKIALDGGRDGLRYYRAIAHGWKNALRLGGRLILECGMGQAGAVREILAGEGFGDFEVYKDNAGIERVISARYTDTDIDIEILSGEIYGDDS